jgi:hypothetical protein
MLFYSQYVWFKKITVTKGKNDKIDLCGKKFSYFGLIAREISKAV